MIQITEDFFSFIDNNLEKDPIQLLLAFKKNKWDFDMELAVTQIICRKKNVDKLKSFLSNPRFLFPDSLSAEQASHQGVAYFHASLVSPKDSVLDMTAGLGIDAFSMSRVAEKVTAVEISEHKAETLKYNADVLKIPNLEVLNEDSVKFLQNLSRQFDLIFIDPARRGEGNKRVYNLKDCIPDVTQFQDLLIKHSPRIIIKASPLLDVSQTLRDLKNIKSVRAIGVKDECKELLIEIVSPSKISKQSSSLLEAINLDKEGKIVSCFSITKTFEESEKGDIEYIDEKNIFPGDYLLEPSPMVMKIAPWSEICKRFKAKKLDKSSHLFISKEEPKDFPGKVSKFEKFINKRDRKNLIGFPASVVSKNHPLSPDEIRKNFNLKESDNNFIYATRIDGKPIMMLTFRTLSP